ncbi:hypothetical protein [Streptomyces sp. NPDC001966]
MADDRPGGVGFPSGGVKTVAATAVDAESKGYAPDRPRNLSRSVIPSF